MYLIIIEYIANKRAVVNY